MGQVFSQLYITSRALLRALCKGKIKGGITIKIRSFPESVISISCSWGIGKMQKGLSLNKSLRTLSCDLEWPAGPIEASESAFSNFSADRSTSITRLLCPALSHMQTGRCVQPAPANRQLPGGPR